MHHDKTNDRRRFLRTALTGTGILACPWFAGPAFATAAHGAFITFQVPPDGQRFFVDLFAEINAHYRPDLGRAPIALPGASGGVAVETVVRSPRDGGTVLIAPSTMLSLAPVVFPGSEDPADRLIPVAAIGQLALAFLVGPAVPAQVRTMADYVEWVRANPRANSVGIPGLGTATHYVGAEVARLADVSLRAVGYKGVLPLMQDVASGTVPAAIGPEPTSSDLARVPQLRTLAVTGDRRSPLNPDVPTLRETGFGESLPKESLGFFLPTGTPDDKVRELAAAVDAATRTAPLIASMASVAMVPVVSDGAYAKAVADERATWKTLVARHDFTGGR